MKMDYTHYEEDKRTSKEMAREMVGDGQTPNLWFVTYGPFIMSFVDGEGDYEKIEGYDEDKDTDTYGPFASYQEALDKYNDINLDYDYGIGQVFIEDRQCGTVTEKYLEKVVRIDYSYCERDDSKLFYKK
jgi:hypothetical protein